MLNESGYDATATEGEHSQFDVLAGDALIFSKQHEGRFPEEDEIVAALADR